MHTSQVGARYEKLLWQEGFKTVGGVDEVGRGALAGPVYSAVVSFQKSIRIPKEIIIDDSKVLTPKLRLHASSWIRANALCWGIGSANVTEIEKYGINKATQKSMRRAIVSAERKGKIDYLLIDAFYIPKVNGLPQRRKSARRSFKFKDSRGRQLAIVDGDAISISIASASIIAKVERDDYMVRVGKSRLFLKYQWHKNKGYGTKEHITAIKKYGVTKIHRKSFLKNIT